VRVTTARSELEVTPGETASLFVDVVNTDRVIDGVSARVIGLPEESIRCEPALLPLFPDATGQLTVTVAPPRHMVAGRHPIAIEISSHGAQAAAQYLEITLIVAPDPQLQLTSTPRIAKGRVAVVLHLLSPAQRPIQVTQDLRGFWERTYPEVKKELKGRYPRHPWPDDPWSAKATARAKPRGT